MILYDPETQRRLSRSQIARHLAERITRSSRRPVRFMEVCGTHTVSIFRSGIRSMLPETISLLSGPGCPVCVTAQKEIDAFIALAREPETIVATFGDLIRVPGSGSSLQREKADGADVRIVYSTFDAVDLARENPDKRVVFLGVGFETTAPTVAAAIWPPTSNNSTIFPWCRHTRPCPRHWRPWPTAKSTSTGSCCPATSP
jgi:hydrogenase expression/formation protein HypD